MHISQSTKDSLQGEFELEPGNGGERCDYLQEKDIDTYLVLPPKHLPNELNGNVSIAAALLSLYTLLEYLMIDLNVILVTILILLILSSVREQACCPTGTRAS